MDFSKNKYIQHAIAVFVIAVASLLYFFPESQGKKILSHDQLSSVAAAGEREAYAEKGETILWSSRIFGGMPLFQTAYRVDSNLLFNYYYLSRHIFPKSMWLWFMLILGFYISLSILGYNLPIRLIGALAFGLSTWFLLSIEAGHSSKILVISCIPPLLASIFIAYRGKWLLGGVLTSLFLGFALMGNHPQIIYYTLYFIAIIFIYKLVDSITQKTIPAFAKRTLILLGFGILGAIPSSTKMYITYDYAKETIRGGKSELTKEKKQSTGLDIEYAFQYSYGKAESLNLLIPGFAGSGANLDEDSEMFAELRKRGIPKKQALDYLKGIPVFYGEPPVNTGPSYFGAGIIFLFVLMLFIAKGRFKWALLTIIGITLMFAWGRHFGLNEALFDSIPLFNKFRTPSMWLSMAMIAVVFGAMLGLKALIEGNYDTSKIKKSLYMTGGILGGFVVIVYLFKSSFTDFAGPYDAQLEQNGIDIGTLIQDRISLLNADIFRTLLVLALTFGAIWAIINNKLKSSSSLVYVIFAAIIIGDLWMVDKRYLNEDDFTKAKSFESSIKPTAADQQILADKNGHYRVFNTTVSSFNDNITSYFHKSVGGYSAAKLIRYQDIIERHLSQGSMPVFNMLNTKYFITGQPGQEMAQQNPAALGNVWFVNDVSWAKNADDEVAQLKDFNPASTAIIDERFKDYMNGMNINASSGQIALSKFHPDNMEYTSESTAESFAVFSEIWYKGNEDWKAYIDGKETEFIRVNYLLRGLKIPAGNHKIEFKFYPEAHYTGSKISFASSLLIILMVAGLFVYVVIMKKELPGMKEDELV